MLRSNLRAVDAFVTAENVSALIADAGFEGDIGLLSIDIDGNDYWVWKAITKVSPSIVVCEFNRFFGVEKSVTIPYQASFASGNDKVHAGASLAALCFLAQSKGYDFVGCTSEGVNAFFVRKEFSKAFEIVTPKQAFNRISLSCAARVDFSRLFPVDPNS